MQTQLIPNCFEAGCDEAGRGCLAGPVFAAAVILPENIIIPDGIQDSKGLDETTKLEMREWIIQNALAYSIQSCSAEFIDTHNILNASIFAMQTAVENLNHAVNHIVVDGNRFKPVYGIPHTCVIQGDAKLKNIAAASILAKTERDAFMERIAQSYPMYHWHSNKGYPSPEHKKAIAEFGYSPFHRKTFKGVKEFQPLPEQLNQPEL